MTASTTATHSTPSAHMGTMGAMGNCALYNRRIIDSYPPQCTVFLDTETTGLHDARRAWEISMIRRHPGLDDATITIFIHLDDIAIEHAEPAALDIGRFHDRHPAFGAPLTTDQLYLSERDAMQIVDDWTYRAEIFGIKPRFDTDTLTEAFIRHHRQPRWWREPRDITDLAQGWVQAHGNRAHRNPEALSAQCGIAVPANEQRHTAYGDAEWVKRWYDLLFAATVTP